MKVLTPTRSTFDWATVDVPVYCAVRTRKYTPVAEVDKGKASRLACLAVVGNVYPGNWAEGCEQLLQDKNVANVASVRALSSSNKAL